MGRDLRSAVRLRIVFFAVLVALLAATAPALAADGKGWYGELDDKVITNFGFGVILFFPILVTVLSIVQGRLESRKERARAEIEKATRPD